MQDSAKKMQEDSNRAIQNLMVSMLDLFRHGDMTVAGKLGIDVEAIRHLDKLKPDQISRVSQNYLRGMEAVDIFTIDSEKMSKVIKLAAEEIKYNNVIDEFLLHGACKNMMTEMFGYRSMQIAASRRLLDIPTVKGRPAVPTLPERHQIYDAWLADIEIVDIRERYLSVARKTKLPLHLIYRVVLDVEEVQKQKKSIGNYA